MLAGMITDGRKTLGVEKKVFAKNAPFAASRALLKAERRKRSSFGSPRQLSAILNLPLHLPLPAASCPVRVGTEVQGSTAGCPRELARGGRPYRSTGRS